MMYGPPNYAGHTSPATFQGRRGQFQHAVYKKRDVFHIFDVITWKGGIAALINSCYQTQMEQWWILLGQNQSSYSCIYSSRSRSTLEPDPASGSMKASLLGHYLSQAIDQLFRSPQKKIVMHAHRSWLYHSSRKRSCSRRCIAMLTTDLFKSLNLNSVRNDVLRRPSFNSTACFALVLLFLSSCGKKS
jgi:hypothetical protein